MNSSDIIIRREYGTGAYATYTREVNPEMLGSWIDSVEARLESVNAQLRQKDVELAQQREVLVGCTEVLEKLTRRAETQNTALGEIGQGLAVVRSVLQGLIETQAEMQITKADRSELNG